MKIVNVIFTSSFLLVLAACGGGGGGSSDAATTPPDTAASSPAQQVLCPDQKTSAAKAADCPATTLLPVDLKAIALVSPEEAMLKGYAFIASGTIAESGFHATVTQGHGKWTLPVYFELGPDKRTVNVILKERPAYGTELSIVFDALDSVGNPVTSATSLSSTPAMVCADNSKWSNPASFNTAIQDCVAPIGVQALITDFNVMSDRTCELEVEKTLSSACQLYFANGTISVMDTGTVLSGGHSAWWTGFVGGDGVSYLALIDQTTSFPVAALKLSDKLSWLIGNPRGVTIRVGAQTLLASWDGAKIALSCLVGC